MLEVYDPERVMHADPEPVVCSAQTALLKQPTCDELVTKKNCSSRKRPAIATGGVLRIRHGD